MEPILSVKDLSVSFQAFAGTVHAVRDVNFDLMKGETLAIVGESGSGKAVTIKAILGILAKNGHIDSGSILYQGEDMAKYKEKDFYKIRGKRISEALILSGSIEKSKAKQRAIELMEAVGIPNAAERYEAYPFQFSGGMRQRIVIAIALACNPEILICDEPTTALDVTIQARILELINDMKREHDLSVIFITHDLGVVANIADRVCVMYAGRIVEVGTCEDIFYHPAHPYTWALLSAMPDLHTEETLYAIPGAPPNMLHPPKGDAFAARNKYAMKIDFEKEPPYFKISDTHYAATWLLHSDAPKVEMPEILQHRIARMKEEAEHG